MANIEALSKVQSSPAINSAEPQIASQLPQKKDEPKTSSAPEPAVVEFSSQSRDASEIKPLVKPEKDTELKQETPTSPKDMTQDKSEFKALDMEQVKEYASDFRKEIEETQKRLESTASSKRQTKFRIEDGNISVTVQRGDKEIEIPPEKLVEMKRNLGARLDAFKQALSLKIDITA